MKNWRSINFCAAVAAAALLNPFHLQTANATPDEWLGTTNSTFSVATNWNGGAVPMYSQGILFDNAGNGHTNLTSVNYLRQGSPAITFNAGAVAYVVGVVGGSNQTAFCDESSGATAVSIASGVTSPETVNIPFTEASAGYCIFTNASSYLYTDGGTFAGTVASGSGTFNPNGAGPSLFTGAISDTTSNATGSGILDVKDSGTGIVTLTE